MSTYTPEEYTMTLTASTDDYTNLSAQYVKNLAAAMQRTKDAIARDLFFPRPKRLKEDNPYTHGALNAIHKDT
jgi:hypothetical protein